MKQFAFKGILTKNGWLEPGYVKMDRSGRIIACSNHQPGDLQACEEIDGYLIPGFQNAHSHAFQYAMAGLAEHLPAGAAEDNFWSWRNAMYELALNLDPEDMQAIATMAYADMLRQGYTAVAEFHYLHHDKQGKPYGEVATLSQMLIEAARQTGIHLTLVPVYYQTGDFGTSAVTSQRRFIFKNVEGYLDLIEAVKKAKAGNEDMTVGIGFHSLRAAPADAITQILASEHGAQGPIHIHIAEQRREVAACTEFYGQPPVAWLSRHCQLDHRFHLVHATHMTPQECEELARSGAHAVICPSTEGNLGDGFFPFRKYLELGGRWSIGSDSHVGLNPLEELRWLDYGSRLCLEKRNIACFEPGDDSGTRLFQMAWTGGRAAMGQDTTAYFEPGHFLDGVVIATSHPLIRMCHPQRRLSTLVYAQNPTAFSGTLRKGEWVVKDGIHHREEEIRSQFTTCMQRLRNRL